MSAAHNFHDQLVNSSELEKELKKREKNLVFETISQKQLPKYLEEGWSVIRENASGTVRISREKNTPSQFNDDLWCLLANLGFTSLNKLDKISIPCFDNPNETYPVSLFAADEEVILLVFTKATPGEAKRSNFQDEIKRIGEKKEQLINTVRKNFSTAKHKVKFIFATQNYILSETDKSLLDNYSIFHFDDETIQYYYELNKHLGLSGRFQLLGNLFEGQTIPQLENQIPAIQGKMGGHTYYSFSIEPEKLLKIGYVLHRNKANKKLMPTYQRIIKKSRLKSVQEFVESGGFFPNSIIININASKGVKFDKANTQVENAISRVGVLHLPKTYRSSFIIDGQHRLYGYANSTYKKTNSIPVVAFVNLDRNQQIKLFMQINENQKAVPKNLRNTLNADLLWDSEDLTEAIKALKLQIAQDLGEELDSALYERIIIGENPKSATRCITIDTIRLGLDKSNFFGVFTKNAVKTEGTFYGHNNDQMYDRIMPFLKGLFGYIRENSKAEWDMGESGEGYLCINAGIESLLRLFSDIADHLAISGQVNIRTARLKDVIEKATPFLDPLIDHFKQISTEEKTMFRKSYGSGARAKYWRTLQKIIHAKIPTFEPAGFADYLRNEEKQFNNESFNMIRDIEQFLKKDFREKLEAKFGASWFKKGVHPNVYDAASLLSVQKNRELEKHEEVEPWDCLNIIDYRKIALYQSNWKDIFERSYTKPGEEKMRGNREERTSWLVKLERIRNQNFHSYSVKEEEYNFLVDLHNWLIAKTTQNTFSVGDIE